MSKIGKISQFKKSKFFPIVLVQKVTFFPKKTHIKCFGRTDGSFIWIFQRKSELTGRHFSIFQYFFKKLEPELLVIFQNFHKTRTKGYFSKIK